MQVDLGDLNPGTWFEMTGGGKISLRVCSGDAFREIRKKTVQKKAELKPIGRTNTLQRIEYEVVDDDLQSQLIWEYCIVDWSDLLDKNLNQIACTNENKKLLMGQSVVFSKFVTDCLDKLRISMEGEQEEEPEKN